MCWFCLPPLVDITNIDTSKLKHSDKTEVFQQKAIASSRNMFHLTRMSLEENSHLSKVIILEHPPRFDKQEADPISLKPDLARLANATLGQMWLNSPLKNRIFIGHHSLESSGNSSAHFERYQNQNSGRYDGVHLYGKTGRRDYTNSVKSILMMAFPEVNPATTKCGSAQQNSHEKCPQTNYQEKTKYHPSVQPRNRFNVFNSNMGNC